VPLLELLHRFIKTVQAWNIYVVDFIEAMKLVKVDMYGLIIVQSILHSNMMFLLTSTT